CVSIRRPFAVPYVNMVPGRMISNRPAERGAGVRGDRVWQRRKQVRCEPSIEAKARFPWHAALDYYRLDAAFEQMPLRSTRLVGIRIAMTNVGDAMPRCQSFQQVQRANALAGIEGERQFLIDYGDAQGKRARLNSIKRRGAVNRCDRHDVVLDSV